VARGCRARRDQAGFQLRSEGGPGRTGSLVIRAGRREGLDGHWETTVPVSGGRWYRFQAFRRVENVPVPRRSVLARVHWLDDSGRHVPHDMPGARSYAPDRAPRSEPEYPNDGATDRAGWTEVAGVYHVPSKATRAAIELHLRWAPQAKAEWSGVSLAETQPPAPRTVRLATVHYVPKGGKTPVDSCRQFDPFVAEAARQRATSSSCPKRSPAPATG